MVTGKQANRVVQQGESDLANVADGDTVILLRIPGVRLSPQDVQALLATIGLPREGNAGAGGGRPHLCHGTDAPETYVYLAAAADPASVQQALGAAYDGADAFLLTVTQIIDGAAAGRTAGWHYVVETDVLPEAETDFNDWYACEHLPGLAAVPGTVRAMRLRNSVGSPRYHALYLLADRETFGSEPWLLVRATEWSSRVRPNFINTKRTMFGVAPG